MMLITGFVIVFIIEYCSGRIIQSPKSFQYKEFKVKVDVKEYNIPSCDGDDFCDRPSFYPSREILQLVTNASAGLDNMFAHEKDTSEDAIEENERGRGIFGQADSVCMMFHQHIRPKVAKNTKGKFMFLVNAPDHDDESRFVQIVQTGQCMGAGQGCMGAWPGYQSTECRQQFLEHKLVAVDQNLQEIIVDSFRFPSCCTCHILSTYDL